MPLGSAAAIAVSCVLINLDVEIGLLCAVTFLFRSMLIGASADSHRDKFMLLNVLRGMAINPGK
jgi:hypothetical protein